MGFVSVKLAQLPVELEAPGADVAPAVLDALDCLRVAVTVFDSDERLVYANAHFNYLFRSLPAGKVLPGLAYADLIRLELAGGEIALEGDAEGYIAWRRAQLSPGNYAPLDIHLADGRIIEIKARQTSQGGWIALWSDATQARHVLGRLEDAIDLSADAFAFWDREDRLTLCNAAFAELHGHASAEDLARVSFESLIESVAQRGHVRIEGDARDWILRRMEAHRSSAGALTVAMASGAAYLVRERATRDGGRATVYTDITDSKRVENALEEQTRTLARTKRALVKSQSEAKKQANYLADLAQKLDAASSEADTAKTTLLRTMSHELKTPLNAILGFADLLRSMADRFTVEQIAEYSGLIHLAGNNLLRLINQILELTKIAAGRYTLHPVTIPALNALGEAMDFVAARAAEKSITLKFGICGGEVLADEAGLTTMLRNLLENAVNFTHNGGEVCLSSARVDGRVRFTIADNGPGVAAADLARIIEPFEQAGRSMADHSHGAGLGLPLVKALAELQGGALAIESTLGEGFTVTLELPAA